MYSFLYPLDLSRRHNREQTPGGTGLEEEKKKEKREVGFKDDKAKGVKR